MARYALKAMGVEITSEVEAKIVAFDQQKGHGKNDQDTFCNGVYAICGATAHSLEDFKTQFKKQYDACRSTPEFVKARNGHLLPGALETLLFLKKHDIPFFIASNSPQIAVRNVVRMMLNNPDGTPILAEDGTPVLSNAEIDKVVFGDKARLSRKPNAEMLKAGFKAIGVQDNSRGAYYVGNNFKSDVLAALRCECRPILFCHTALSTEEKIDEGEIHDLSERPGTAIHAYARMRDADGNVISGKSKRLDIYPVEYIEPGKPPQKRYIPAVHDHHELLCLFQSRIREAEDINQRQSAGALETFLGHQFGREVSASGRG